MKKWIVTLSLMSFFYQSNSYARVEVHFFIRFNIEGIVRLLPHEDYFHVAIQTEWSEGLIHVRPRGVVEEIQNVSQLGFGSFIEHVLVHEDISILKEEVSKFLDLPYDQNYNWSDETCIYCSELVAKLLNIEPTPMSFSGDQWSEEFKERRGELGISPGELYDKLLELGFKRKSLSCSDQMNKF